MAMSSFMKRWGCTVLCALAGGSTIAQACEPASFSLRHIELQEVARAVSDLTGQAIALDKSVHRVKLSFVVDTPNSCDEVLARFEQLTMERGWLVGESARYLHVMSAPGRLGGTGGLSQALRRMYLVPHASALQWAQRARALLSPDASVQVPDARRLLVVASEADHTRLQELLADKIPDSAAAANY